MSSIDFTRALASGVRSYDRHVGRWWMQRTSGIAHAEAYANIARYVARHAGKRSGLLVDYACGAGLLTRQLVAALPRWHFLGLDGSRTMLRLAEVWARRNGPSVASLEFRLAKLPDFALPRHKADLVVFAFPNIITGARERRHCEAVYGMDRVLARLLAEKREQAGEHVLYDQLFMNRVIARNLRRLLRKGGLCVRVDYSQGSRRELERFDRVATAFEEGSLSAGQGGRKPEKFFDLLYARYYPSDVIRDVYEQTKDEDFLEGGYSISLLRAI